MSSGFPVPAGSMGFDDGEGAAFFPHLTIRSGATRQRSASDPGTANDHEGRFPLGEGGLFRWAESLRPAQASRAGPPRLPPITRT